MNTKFNIVELEIEFSILSLITNPSLLNNEPTEFSGTILTV